MKILKLSFPLLLLFLAASCGDTQKASGEYAAEINKWHEERINRLKEDEGWLNLAGLYWLEEGENRFGSAKDNDVIFPEGAPEYIGSFFLEDSVVTMKINDGNSIYMDSSKVHEIRMIPDITGNPGIFTLGNYRWFLVQRGEDKYGIRLRDLEVDLVKNFPGIERFPVDSSWKLTARYVPYEPEKIIEIPTIIGTSDEETVKGKLEFNVDEKTYSLDPVNTGSGFFIIFADQTNGEETYGAGRFLYASLPDSNNNVVLDFNKAYNPPCAFTKYATCPLPPEGNRLAVKIKAGEKSFGSH